MHIRIRLTRRSTRLALAAFALAAAAPVDAQVVRVIKRDSTQARDTFTVRILRTGGQDSLLVRIDSVFRRLDREPLGSADRTALETSIQALMTRLTSLVGENGDLGMRLGNAGVSFRDAVSRAVIEQSAAMRQLRSSMPRGWIGIYAEGPRMHRIVNDNEIIHYFSYPSIVSVEPNSPAERAGILAGDTLVAYDRADLRDREINLSRLLVPDRKLAVTVRRDGDTKEYQMIVAKAPEDFVRTRVEINGPVPDSLLAGRIFWRGSGGPPEAVGFVARGRSVPSGEPVVGRMEKPTPAARPQPAGLLFGRPFDGARSIWGAQLATIDEGLGRTLGVKSGVLVTAVASATPASRSGLESGDIIVKVAGRRLVSVDELRRAVMEREADHEVELQVQRAKKLKTIKVRWPL